MSRVWTILLVIFIGSNCKAQFLTDQDDSALVQSTILIEARIVEANATYDGFLAKLNQLNYCKAKVDAVKLMPKDLPMKAGTDITLVFASAVPPEGDTKFFYCEVFMLGESIALRVIHQSLLAHSQPAKRKKELTLAYRINNADFVLEGKVLNEPKAYSSPDYGSEHAPNWQKVTVQLMRTWKKDKNIIPSFILNDRGERIAIGHSIVQEYTLDTLSILFPSSGDVLWVAMPKLAKGDHYIFILNRYDAFMGPYVFTKPQDLMSLERAPEIDALFQ